MSTICLCNAYPRCSTLVVCLSINTQILWACYLWQVAKRSVGHRFRQDRAFYCRSRALRDNTSSVLAHLGGYRMPVFEQEQPRGSAPTLKNPREKWDLWCSHPCFRGVSVSPLELFNGEACRRHAGPRHPLVPRAPPGPFAPASAVRCPPCASQRSIRPSHCTL